MKFDWSKFTEKSFREMRKIIVESRQDNYFTEGALGIVRYGVIEMELRLLEDADNEFLILLNYHTPDGSLDGSTFQYDADCLYPEFQEEVEGCFQDDLRNIPQLAAIAGTPARNDENP